MRVLHFPALSFNLSILQCFTHADPSSTRMGVDVIAGEAGDMKELGIFESFKVKHQVRLVFRRYGRNLPCYWSAEMRQR
jgi:hypothetical protein